MNVFSTRVIPSIGVDILSREGIRVTPYMGKVNLTQEELIATCQQYDALISAGPNHLNRHFFQQCRHLKAVALFAVGYDNVDVEAAKEFGIQVGNTPGVLSKASADIAFLLMINVARNAMYMHSKIRNGEWGFYEPTADLGIDLDGKTLGIYGLGRIGYEMARKSAGAYGMKIIYHNRTKNLNAEKELGATWVSFDELLAQSDVVSVHAKLTPETQGVFDLRAFSSMKPDALFINSARGGIHNEEDLTIALNEKKIRGAGLDVTNPEPMKKNNPLLTMPHVCILPHIGSATRETRDAMAVLVAKNILAGLRGAPMPHCIWH